MPIARVRIAPMERWCDPVRDWLEGDSRIKASVVAGSHILIDTAKMRESYEGLHGAVTKFWFVLPQSQQELLDKSGAFAFGGAGGYVCEHFLEID